MPSWNRPQLNFFHQKNLSGHQLVCPDWCRDMTPLFDSNRKPSSRLALGAQLADSFVQYSKDSPNRFRRRRRRGIPPAKIRKGGGAAPLTISSFSLAALNSEFAERIPRYWIVMIFEKRTLSQNNSQSKLLSSKLVITNLLAKYVSVAKLPEQSQTT